LRVIAGSARGAALYGAKGRKLRPVLDRVKESMFNLLSDRVEDARVLDLFAGVGSFGIEALSRGAHRADFIEQHAATARAINENLNRAHLQDRGVVHVARLPGGLAAARGLYGLIFIDPPFRIDQRLLDVLFRLIYNRGLLEEDGLAIYRYSPHGNYKPPVDKWLLEERRDYGDSIVSIYSPVRRDGRKKGKNLERSNLPWHF